MPSLSWERGDAVVDSFRRAGYERPFESDEGENERGSTGVQGAGRSLPLNATTNGLSFQTFRSGCGYGDKVYGRWCDGSMVRWLKEGKSDGTMPSAKVSLCMLRKATSIRFAH